MTLPTRAAVRKLADEVTAGRLDVARALDEALDAANADGALALMIAGATAGRAPSAEQCARALPMLDEIEAVPLAIAATEGDRVRALLDVVERDQMGQSRDALALYIACVLAEGAPPPKLGALLRRQARRSDSPETAAMLLATARATRDVDLVASVCSVLPYIDLPLADDVGARWKKTFATPLLEALDEDAAPRVVASGFTARRTTEKIGRNDPCPCGSGKKYKKCHEGKELPGEAAVDPIAERLRDAASSITPDQVTELRPQDLARLDLASLASPALVRAFRRLVVLRDWKLVERALAELARRPDLGKLDHYRDEVVYEALFAGDAARARAVAATLDDAASLSLACKVGLDLIEPTAESLPRLEERVVAALREEDANPGPLLSIADALLTHAPGVGIVFTRGAINPARDGDSNALIDAVEEARDRLALAPGDPAGAIYDAMTDVDVAKRAKKELAAAKAKQTAAARKQGAALRKKAREAAARVDELQAQLAAQQAALSKSEAAPAAGARASAADDEERRRLRMKIDELKGHIAEGNKERSELRKELAQRAEAGPASGEPTRDDRDDEEDEAPESGEGIAVDARVRGVAVPRFAKAAAEALREVPARIARDALAAVAELAAGDAAAWREVKQLEKAQTPIFSARVGIHYRMLFRTDAAGLEVLELFHRKNLESVVKRYA